MSVGFNANASSINTISFSDGLQGAQGSQGVFGSHKISAGGDTIISASDLSNSDLSFPTKKLSEHSISVLHNS